MTTRGDSELSELDSIASIYPEISELAKKVKDEDIDYIYWNTLGNKLVERQYFSAAC